MPDEKQPEPELVDPDKNKPTETHRPTSDGAGGDDKKPWREDPR